MRPSRTPVRLSPLQPGRVARRRRPPLVLFIGVAAVLIALVLMVH